MIYINNIIVDENPRAGQKTKRKYHCVASVVHRVSYCNCCCWCSSCTTKPIV